MPRRNGTAISLSPVPPEAWRVLGMPIWVPLPRRRAAPGVRRYFAGAAFSRPANISRVFATFGADTAAM
jgi:hypothetical protein